MHSALKHEGKALYEYARAGIEIEREARQITLHGIDVLAWPDEAAMAASVAELAGRPDGADPTVPAVFPELVLDIRCSKGTYIRTLAETIGEMLGCGAHLTALRRTGSGPLDLSRAITLDALEDLPEAGRLAYLLPPDTLLADWPALHLPADEAGRFLSGLRRRVGHVDCAHLRVYGPPPEPPAAAAGAPTRALLLGSAHVVAGELIADRLLSPPEVAALITATVPTGADSLALVMNSSTFTSDTRSFATPSTAAAASI
jgi:tRNA pseudouridine55 synthase